VTTTAIFDLLPAKQLHVRTGWHRLMFDDDIVVDAGCPNPEHDHTLEYLRAFAHVAGVVGLRLDLIPTDAQRLAGVPLLRERFQVALRAYRYLGGTTTEPERQRMHYEAGKLFSEDWCEHLEVVKRPQSRPRVAKMSLDRVFELKRFVERESRFPREGSTDAAEKALAKWLAKQRVTTNHVLWEYLDRHVPMWRFSGREGAWRITLSNVVGFIYLHHRTPSKRAADPAERRLGAWLHNQHTALRGKRDGTTVGRAMSAEQEDLLGRLLPDVFPELRPAHPQAA